MWLHCGPGWVYHVASAHRAAHFPPGLKAPVSTRICNTMRARITCSLDDTLGIMMGTPETVPR